MSITAKLELDERMGWKTYVVRIDDESICGITEATGEEPVNRFVQLLKDNEIDVRIAHAKYLERLNWNISHPGMGKPWPEMRSWERLKQRLLTEAGVHDS